MRQADWVRKFHCEFPGIDNILAYADLQLRVAQAMAGAVLCSLGNRADDCINLGCDDEERDEICNTAWDMRNATCNAGEGWEPHCATATAIFTGLNCPI
jgi:hypothetical protein